MKVNLRDLNVKKMPFIQNMDIRTFHACRHFKIGILRHLSLGLSKLELTNDEVNHQ